MPKYSRGVLRLLGVLMVVALLAPMPSLIEGAKPDDNFGSRECKRCKDSCNETRKACQDRCFIDCRDMFDLGTPELDACLTECNGACADARNICFQLCKPLCQGESPSEP